MKKLLITVLIAAAFGIHLGTAGAAQPETPGGNTIVQDNQAAQLDEKAMREIDKHQKKMLKKAEKARKKAEKARKKALKNKKNENAEQAPDVQNTGRFEAGVSERKIMQLEECIKYALENHPAVHAAMNNAEIFKSRIVQAWSAYFPVLSAAASYSRNDMLVTTMAPPVQRYDLYYMPNLSANMLIFDFGKTKAAADMSKRSYEAAQHGLESSINNVVFNVKQSYYNLLFAHQQVKVYEDTVHDFALHLEQAKAYYEIGSKPKIDVLTAEYNLGKAKLSLIQAQNTLNTAFVQLNNAMGMPELTNYDAADNVPEIDYKITMEDAVNTAYETNPQLLAAKKKADASYVLVRASKRAFLPDITGFASYTRGGRKINSDDGYQIGAQIGWQGVNLLLLKKQTDEAKSQYNKDYAEFQNIKNNIYLEVKQAYLNMITAKESINVSRLSMKQAQEQYDSAAGRYKSGLGDAVELKDAETTFRNAQLNYYRSMLDYNVSAANLECLTGVPLNNFNNNL